MKRVWMQLRCVPQRRLPRAAIVPLISLICSLMLVWRAAALSPPAQARGWHNLAGGDFLARHSRSLNPTDGFRHPFLPFEGSGREGGFR